MVFTRQRRSKLPQMPLDVFELIMSYITTPVQYTRMRGVCKLFHNDFKSICPSFKSKKYTLHKKGVETMMELKWTQSCWILNCQNHNPFVMKPFFWKYSMKKHNLTVHGNCKGQDVQLTVPWSRWSIKLNDFYDIFQQFDTRIDLT